MAPLRSRPRILAYADSEVFSGAEAVFADVLHELHDADLFDVECAAAVGNVHLHEALDGIRTVSAPRHPGPFGGVRQRLKGSPTGLADGRDLMLVNLPSAEHAHPALRAARQASVTCFGVLHIHQAMGQAGFRLGAARDLFNRRALSSALSETFVVAPGAAGQSARTWGLEPDSVHQLPLRAPDVGELPARGEARATLGVRGNRRLVALPGRVSIKQKGHDILVDVASKLADVDDLQWLVAGDGPDTRAVQALVAGNGLTDRFTFSGHAPIATVLAASDAVLLPSRFEGLPLVALECLQAHLPGVVSGVDGLGAVWPERWIAGTDPEQLAEAVRALLHESPDVLRQEMVEAERAASAFVGRPGRIILDRILARLEFPAGATH